MAAARPAPRPAAEFLRYSSGGAATAARGVACRAKPNRVGIAKRAHLTARTPFEFDQSNYNYCPIGRDHARIPPLGERVADQDKIGTHWTVGELDAIVADYFVMLGDELAGRSYVKSDHNAALVARTGQTRGSVDSNIRNISAVLERMGGLPWIFGFKPARDYQGALFDAIDRYLSKGLVSSISSLRTFRFLPRRTPKYLFRCCWRSPAVIPENWSA